MFMFLFADLQYFFIGAIFLFSGIRKIISNDASMISIHSVLSKILKRTLITKLTYQAIGFIELIVGLLLLLPYSYPWSIYLATIIIVGFVGYDFFGIKITPGRPCGCMGWSEDSVSWRTIIRSILLLALCILGWQSRYFWFDTYKTNILICSLIMVSQFSLLIVISPEIMAHIRKMLLHNGDRSVIKKNVDCAYKCIPISEAIKRLSNSDAFKSLARNLISDIQDQWRSGCWWFFTFKGKYHGQKTTIVFAVSLHNEPESVSRVSAAIVNDDEQKILLTIPSISEVSYATSSVSQT